MNEYAVPEDKLEKKIAKKYADIIEHDGKKLGVKISIVPDKNGEPVLGEDGVPFLTVDIEEIKEGENNE